MRRPLCLLCATFVAALILCMQFIPLPLPDISGAEGRRAVLEGTVCQKEYRETAKGTVPVICLKKVRIPNTSEIPQNQINGVMCYMEDGGEPEMGSLVRVQGNVRCFSEAGNPGEFDSRRYYRILGLDFRLEDAALTAVLEKGNGFTEGLYRMKQYFSRSLDACFGERDASVMKALLLGEKSGLDSGIKELYQENGIIHILAISGLHISLIGLGLYRLLIKCGLPRRVGAPLCAAVIVCYGIMTGMSVSAARAVFMFALSLAAQLCGRTYDMPTALSLSAAFTLVRQPLYAGHSGFLFSFGAVAALAVLLPALYGEGPPDKHPEKKRLRDRLWKAAAPGVSIAIATLPVHLLFNFNFPVYSILLNLILLPLMPFLMCAGLFCMCVGSLCLPAALCASWADKGILWFYERCCLLFLKLPYGHGILGRPDPWQIAVYAALLVLLILFHKKVSGWWKAQWLLLAVCFLLFRPADGLQITALDVGQGDCIHIRSGTGRHYLIDGGSSSKKDTGAWQILPYLKSQGAGRLRAVWVTHSDADHCNGIRTLLEEADSGGVRVDNLILPDIAKDSRDDAYRELVRLAEKKDIRVLYMSRGQYLTDGELKFYCLHPEKDYDTTDANEYSLVLRLTFGSFSGIFTGDVEGKGEEELKKYLGKSKKTTLLKAAHHGSGNSTDEELLSLLQPRLSFISCGKNNRYGHPHPELLQRLSDCGSEVYITRDSGALTVWTDGRKLRVETFR